MIIFFNCIAICAICEEKKKLNPSYRRWRLFSSFYQR